MPELLGADDDAPTYLVPKMGEFAVSNTAFYTSLYITDINEPPSELTPIEAQIDPFATISEDGENANTPAVGVLLTHEQGWFQEGLALGTLLHSLCLAPGEVTKVAIVDWQRRAAAVDAQATDQSEEVASASDQALSTTEVQRAQAKELQYGRSSGSSVSSQSNVGGSVGFLGMGVSGSTSLAASHAHSASMSTGVRNLSAESSRDVSQRTEQLSQATRSRRSTQVREVQEGETENVTTRVVANYNRMHALTVQYYEVLQVYALRTRVSKAERCLFVPLKVTEFSSDNLPQFREVLVAIATDLGFEDLRALLMEGSNNAEAREAELVAAQSAVEEALKNIETARKALDAHMAHQPQPPVFSGNIVKFSQAMASYANAMPKWAARAKQLQAQIPRAIAAHAKTLSKLAALKERHRVSGERLIEFLNRDKLILNQMMWMRLDAHRVHALLAKHTFRDNPLAGLIDPKPVGVFGNYVAFRWHFDDKEQRDSFSSKYVMDEGTVDTTVVLPSDGVFAEAVLGQSNAAEKIDLTRFWDWGENPIPILPPDIAAIETGSRATEVATKDGGLEPSLAALGQLQSLPGSDLAAILSALQQGSIFRNMSGIEQTAELAKQTSGAASKGASEAAKTALEAQKAYADTMVKLANSEAGKAAVQLAMTATPQGKAATVLGGLMNAGKGSEEPSLDPKPPINTGMTSKLSNLKGRNKGRG
ncbi:hypothetical protein C8N43_2516 [Litoreibacter ponti]|uniref:Uncharacterized protein n=1 Tax=Litoreibacter ponti TaxID=1510457 RepID=A0A2T6BP33_9RHOB|nr:hypothetical protein [Litoreibacter ponti]PTX57843.1 hypothetical protein C8N43_2516 [Litoreibacter ponti]